MSQANSGNQFSTGPWPGGWIIVKQSIVDLFTNIVPFLVGLIPVAALLLAVGVFLISHGSNTIANTLAFVIGFVSVVALVYMGLCLASSVPLYALARADGRKMDTKAVYTWRWRILWRLLVASLLLTIPIIIGFILLILPGIALLIWLLPTLSVLPLVVAEQDLGVVDSIKAAHSLVKPHWGKAWGLIGWWAVLSLAIIIPLVIIGIVILAVFFGHAHAAASFPAESSAKPKSGGLRANPSGGGGANPFTAISFAYLYRWINSQEKAS